MLGTVVIPRLRRVLAERSLALDELHRRLLARGDAPRRRAPNGNIDRRLTARHLPPLECLFAADLTCAAVEHRWRPRARIAITFLRKCSKRGLWSCRQAARDVSDVTTLHAFELTIGVCRAIG